jgi:7,8-dihydropterin-6-yl-methyl-4-(beta-D-ribofuranosyl)aminobenzene 5'-phosphate synthase
VITEPPSEDTVSGALRVSILCEDSLSRRGLVGEHGLSILVETADARVLLDAGPSAATVQNARSMDLELAPLDAIVISHGHYDHTGGLAAILAELGGATVIVHPLAFRERYALRGTGAHRFIGPPHTVRKYQQLGAEFTFSEGPVHLGNGLWTTGEVQQAHKSCLDSTRLCIKRDGELMRDDFRDDVSLVAHLDGGLVVLTGCGHAGVCNIVAHAQRLMSRQPVHALIGGTHLVAAHEGEIRDTAARLHEMGVEAIMPCHCTGQRAFAVLEDAFPGKVVKVATGDVVEFTEDALRPHGGQFRLVQHNQLVSTSERRR